MGWETLMKERISDACWAKVARELEATEQAVNVSEEEIEEGECEELAAFE